MATTATDLSNHEIFSIFSIPHTDDKVDIDSWAEKFGCVVVKDVLKRAQSSTFAEIITYHTNNDSHDPILMLAALSVGESVGGVIFAQSKKLGDMMIDIYTRITGNECPLSEEELNNFSMMWRFKGMI